jgi:urease accessory protein
MRDALALVRLLQLASPALPIGAYSYSQGLEWMVDCGEVRTAADAQRWIGDLLDGVIGPGEAAVVGRCADAVARADWSAFGAWNAWFRASRESAELAAETLQMGGSLAKLLSDLDLAPPPVAEAMTRHAPLTLPAAYGVAAAGLRIATRDAVTAYVWSWVENQVLAALKAVPFGQVAGQKMLLALGERIPGVVDAALAIRDDDIASFAPGLAIASARHETQYSRLFRS